MSLRRAALCFALFVLSGCDPYGGGREGEFNAGPVDAVNFPPEYLGVGGDRLRAGSGTFVASRAFVGGQPLGYYLFSFPPVQIGAVDPLRLDSPALGFPTAYVFDPGTSSPFPTEAQCQKPSPDYRYTLTDPNRASDPILRAAAIAGDGINYGEQGNIFTLLPAVSPPGYVQGVIPTTRYAPIVSQTPVRSAGQPCQSIKSEKTLQSSRNVGVEAPDGRYLAWAIIDPSAGVYTYLSTGPNAPGTSLRGGIPRGGVGLQNWGWFDHYLLAYLDGGYIPTQTVGGNLVAVAQTLYLPDRVAGSATVGPGRGYDVLQARRNQAGYSPICRIRIYTPPNPAALPTDETTILLLGTRDPTAGTPPNPPTTCPAGAPAGSICAAPRFVYCLQLP